MEAFQRILAEKDGLSGFPEAYQIVVKAQVQGTMALDVAYATHRIISREVRRVQPDVRSGEDRGSARSL
jgi:hypothetical protein